MDEPSDRAASGQGELSAADQRRARARERAARERPVRERPARERPVRERPTRERPVRERRARERPARDEHEPAPDGADELAEGEAPAAGADRIRAAEVKLMRFGTRLRHFRYKFLALQEAMVVRLGLTSCELGDPSAEIFPLEILKSPDAPVRVIAFGGMGAGLGLPPKQFFKTFRDRNCEVIFAKDFRQCWYQLGLLGISKDVPSTLDYLRELTSDGKPLVTVGASSGGFAAILFGAMLGAQRIVAFSPQTLITRRVFNMFKSEDSEIGEVDFATKWTDLRAVLEEHPLKGWAEIIHSGHSRFDSEQAGRLAGLPGIRLRPLDWNGHNTASHLKQSGELDPMIEKLISG